MHSVASWSREMASKEHTWLEKSRDCFTMCYGGAKSPEWSLGELGKGQIAAGFISQGNFDFILSH